MTTLALNLVGHGPISIEVTQLIIAGWAGRNSEAIEKHIKELEELGVKRPSTVPCFYRVSASLLTTDNNIQVIEKNSSGEVECLIANSDKGLIVMIGSDHTDRKVESYNVAISKQVCAKPLSSDAWLYQEVEKHWDQLEMRCYKVDNGTKALYQEGKTSSLLAIPDLLKKLNNSNALPEETAMLCGTQAVLTEIAHGDEFILELHDPVLNRSLQHHYIVNTLNMVE